jgi:hypothetical protein
MLDEMGSRFWVAHHDEFSLSVGQGLARLGRGLKRFAGRDGRAPQVAAMIAALLITSLGLVTTTATIA